MYAHANSSREGSAAVQVKLQQEQLEGLEGSVVSGADLHGRSSLFWRYLLGIWQRYGNKGLLVEVNVGKAMSREPGNSQRPKHANPAKVGDAL